MVFIFAFIGSFLGVLTIGAADLYCRHKREQKKSKRLDFFESQIVENMRAVIEDGPKPKVRA